MEDFGGRMGQMWPEWTVSGQYPVSHLTSRFAVKLPYRQAAGTPMVVASAVPSQYVGRSVERPPAGWSPPPSHIGSGRARPIIRLLTETENCFIRATPSSSLLTEFRH